MEPHGKPGSNAEVPLHVSKRVSEVRVAVSLARAASSAAFECAKRSGAPWAMRSTSALSLMHVNAARYGMDENL